MKRIVQQADVQAPGMAIVAAVVASVVGFDGSDIRSTEDGSTLCRRGRQIVHHQRVLRGMIAPDHAIAAERAGLLVHSLPIGSRAERHRDFRAPAFAV